MLWHMMNMKLPIQYLNPVVLRCSHFDGYALRNHTQYAARRVHDYELEYYLRSDGGIIIDGKYCGFAAGEMNFRRPGQVVQGVPPYACYILCVDFIGNAMRSGEDFFGSPEEAQPAYDNSLLNRLPGKLVLRRREVVLSLLRSILTAHGAGTEMAYFQEKASTYSLFQEIFSTYAAGPYAGSTAKVNQAVRTIQARFAQPLCVQELVRESGLSHAFFHARFREETGMTPGAMITGLRMDKARNLLCMTHNTIAEVGLLCGYEDSAYFSRVFRRHTGMTPTAYQACMRYTPE